MIHQSEINDFQNRTTNNLRYSKATPNSVEIFNSLDEKVAELNVLYSNENIYNDIWFGFVTGHEYREIMDGPYLHYFMKSKCNKKLCNTVALEGGMDAETLEWFGNTLLPKLLDLGLKYNAIVIPADIFAQQTMEEFEKDKGNNLGRLFPNESKALEWLRNSN